MNETHLELPGDNLKFTSQIFFCSYCLSIDLYKGCSHQCSYCFAQTTHGERLKVCNPKGQVDLFSYKKLIKYINEEIDTNNYIYSYIKLGQPIHIGGMADPFPYMVEEKTGHALGLIKEIKGYPCIWSTKNPIVEYSPFLNKGNHILQYSCIGIEDKRIEKIESGLPSPEIRLNNLEKMKKNESFKKIIVRMQPFIPLLWDYNKLNRFFDRISKIANAVTVEFLKKPMGQNWDSFSETIEFDINNFFVNSPTKDTSDKVFDSLYRHEMLKLLRDMIHERGMEFFSAENNFRHMGDSSSCCGISEKDPEIFQSKLTYCINEMLFKAKKEGSFSFDDIEERMSEQLKNGKWVMGFNHPMAKKSILYVFKMLYGNPNNVNSPSSLFFNLQPKKENGKLIYIYKEKNFSNGFGFSISEYDKKYGNNILHDAKII